MLERPKITQARLLRDYTPVDGTIKVSPTKLMANTTVLGGPFHQWLNPKNKKM